MLDSFRTARLKAERLRPEHEGEFARMHVDPKVMATLGGVRSDEQSRKFFLESLDQWDRDGHGLWVFRDPETNQFVARAGIRSVHVDDMDEIELAYALMAEYWGRGLATEIAETLVAIAFDQLGLDHLICFTMTTNIGSRKVMEKVGFTFERDIVYNNMPHVLYRLNRPTTRGESGKG
ncbi:GNAT family N-acetyltransferase [Singulisphaera rosea]